MLHVLTWCWGDKYPPKYVQRLAAAVERHLTSEHRFVCVSDHPGADFGPGITTMPIIDPELTRIPGCFCRLRTFDTLWQDSIGIAPGDRIVTLDLDAIITGPLDTLFQRSEPFAILQGVNAEDHPCPANGSVWMLTAGYRADVWRGFSIEAAKAIPFKEFPDDQGWMAAMMPDAGAFTSADGVYAFYKTGWPPGPLLPLNARIVAFPGKRDPNHFVHLPWVRRHWLSEKC